MMFGIAVVPTLLFLGAILTVPESPRWLFAHDRQSQAKAVLRSYTDEDGARELLRDIEEGLKAPVEQRWSALWSPQVRGAVFIAAGFTILQQVTGINAVIYYGPRIFELAGVATHTNAIFATLLVAIMNVLATIVGIALVDRVGRKPLLYVGVSGMTVALFVLSWGFGHREWHGAHLGIIALVSLLGYIGCFAFSMGAIAWILVSEVFPLRVRGRGVAVATLASGISNFGLSLTFLSIINTVGDANTFAIFGSLGVVTLIFIWFVVPETCGRDLESISVEPAH